jgi:hypothetical protein
VSALRAAAPELAAAARRTVREEFPNGQTAHLHGLNLSRAWCQRRLAVAAEHAAAAMPHVRGSKYMVEHWLAAYALLYLDDRY